MHGPSPCTACAESSASVCAGSGESWWLHKGTEGRRPGPRAWGWFAQLMMMNGRARAFFPRRDVDSWTIRSKDIKHRVCAVPVPLMLLVSAADGTPTLIVTHALPSSRATTRPSPLFTFARAHGRE
ncbi:hypothetical protein PSPO01_14157 [Paraphaeosphaeria sporulosa]